MVKIKNKAALAFVFLTVVIDVIGMGIILPVLPNLIRELIGSTISEASLYGGGLLFIYAIMQFLFAPILGGLSDQYGRKPILLFSLFGLSVSYIFLALAPTIGWLFFSRMIAGIAGSSLTISSAFIADISTVENKTQNFGLIYVAFGLGFIFGPALGGILGEYGSRIPFIAAAILASLNWLFGYFVLPESLEKSNKKIFKIKQINPVISLINLKKYPMLIDIIWAFFLLSIATHTVESTWSFFTIERFDWSPKDVGWSLAFVGLMSIVVHGCVIRIIIPQIGQRATVFTGIILYAIGFLLLAFATEGWMIYVFLVPYMLGDITLPSMQSIMSNQVLLNEQGELQGALTSLIALASIIGPFIMTSIFAYFTNPEKTGFYFPGAPMILGSILTVVSIGFVAKSFKKMSQNNVY